MLPGVPGKQSSYLEDGLSPFDAINIVRLKPLVMVAPGPRFLVDSLELLLLLRTFLILLFMVMILLANLLL